MRRPARLTAALAGLAGLLVAAPAAGAAVPYTDLGSPAGPLTRVAAGADLSCQAQHAGDPAFEFAPAAAPLGDCGTFVAVDGSLYAPSFGAHDGGTATGALGAYTPFDARGQARDGQAVVTSADLPGSGLQISQRDSYAPGQDAWQTDVTVTNTTGATKSIVLYRAGDCHLQGAGTGYGFAGSPDGSAGCSAQPGNNPLDRVEQWVPISAGATWMQASAPDVWSQIAARAPFPGDCRECTNDTDAAAGLSWALDVPPGASATRSHWTVLSPTGRTGPPPPVAAPAPPPPPPAQVTVQGTVITFTGPARCVRPPERYRLRVTSMRKKKISRDRYGYVRRVRILSVDFHVDGARRARDRKAAFKALVPSAGAAVGAHPLAARITLQPLRERGRQRLVGKPFRRTLKSVATVCG
jgi:hypothetical protein